MTEYRVLDISAHQGQIDYQKVKNAGIWGVMLKCTEGDSYLSPAFQENYDAAKAEGIHLGAYHFLRASTPEEAKREALFFLSKIEGKELDLPVAVDIEAPEQTGLKDLTAIASAFCDELERAGYYAMIYSMVSWFKTKLASETLNAYDRWVAHVSPGLTQPAYQGSYGMWQFTWAAKVDGIGSRVDENKCYRDYPEIIRKAGLNHLPKKKIEKPSRKKIIKPIRKVILSLRNKTKRNR